MNATAPVMFRNAISVFLPLSLLGLIGMPILIGVTCLAQETADQASIRSLKDGDGSGIIIIEGRGSLPEPPVFYTASGTATAQVGSERIEQVIELTAKVIQGAAKTLSFGLTGEGQVTEIQSENLKSWSVRQVGADRFLDLHVNDDTTDLNAVIKLRSPELAIPATIDLTHPTGRHQRSNRPSIHAPNSLQPSETR